MVTKILSPVRTVGLETPELARPGTCRQTSPRLGPRRRRLRASAFERIRALHEDRAIGSILDSYTPDVMMAFVREPWSGNLYVDQRLRTLLDFLGGHHLLLRGQLRRSAEFADMFVMEFPNEGSQPCYCWIFMIDNGKTNNTGKRQYQGALAQYLFHRFHLAGRISNPSGRDVGQVI
jgi:centromere DNA-binding complex CBF3 subunit-like protein